MPLFVGYADPVLYMYSSVNLKAQRVFLYVVFILLFLWKGGQKDVN